MRSLEGTIAANNAAVLQEYQEAVEDKNTELALRILRANPEVFTSTEIIRLIKTIEKMLFTEV